MGYFVVILDCFFKCFELEDVNDRSKYFFLHYVRIVVDCNNSWFNVVARTADYLASAKNFTPLLLNFD